MLSPEDRRAAIAAYANGMLAEQERLGVPADRQTILPEAMAEELAARVAAMPPDQATEAMSDFRRDWGHVWRRALADLARHGLPAEYVNLAGIGDPVTRQTFVKLLSARTADTGAPGIKTKANNGMLQDMDARSTDGVGSEDVVLAMGPAGVGESIAIGPKPTTASQPQQAPSTTYQGASYPRRNRVDLYDNNGDPVMGINAQGQPEQIKVPEGVDLRMFARMGEEDNKLPGHIRGETIRKRLENFKHGGMWDLQRPRLQKDSNGKHIVYDEFIDVASVAIGVYAAAAGLTRAEILVLQSGYAVFNSDFGGAKRHWFWALPERNVFNTDLGYDLYRTGTIPGPVE
jgi:hypothetical protein